jgi:small subunit ribosomal protein S2
LDLQRTLREIDHSYRFTRSVASRGGQLLFVGTKKQAQEPIQAEAERSGMPYVNQRWLGGMLTNFVTMRQRVSYMERLEQMQADGTMATLPKKEQLKLGHELEKLQRNLNGVRDMRELPQALFVVDTKLEDIAVNEARRLNIPIIGLVDTNADPDEVDYVIPGNDDAIRSVALMCRVVAEAVIEGRAAFGNPPVVAEERPEPKVVSGETAAAESAPAPEAAPSEEAPAEAAAPADASAGVDAPATDEQCDEPDAAASLAQAAEQATETTSEEG